MSHSDPLTPQAFSLALLQSELQADLAPRQELQQLRQRIQAAIQQDSSNLDAAIRDYLQQDQQLKQQFESAYDQLERQTHAQERTKFLRMGELRANGQAALTWQDIAFPILTADSGLEAIKLLGAERSGHGDGFWWCGAWSNDWSDSRSLDWSWLRGYLRMV